jgi:uncharacterized membrane protein
MKNNVKYLLCVGVGIVLTIMFMRGCIGDYVPKSKLDEYEMCSRNLNACISNKESSDKMARGIFTELKSIISGSNHTSKMESVLIGKTEIPVELAISLLDSILNSMRRVDESAMKIIEYEVYKKQWVDKDNLIEELRKTNSRKRDQLMALRERLLETEGNVTPRRLIDDNSLFDTEFIEFAEAAEGYIEESKERAIIAESEAKTLKRQLDSLKVSSTALRDDFDFLSMEHDSILKHYVKVTDSLKKEKSTIDSLYNDVAKRLQIALNTPDSVKCEQVLSFLESARNAKVLIGKCGKERRAYLGAAIALAASIDAKDSCIHSAESLRKEFPECARVLKKHPNE